MAPRATGGSRQRLRAVPAVARVLGVSWIARFLDAGRRHVYLSMAAIPGNVATAGWKLSLFVIEPSVFVLANAAFSLGIASSKALVLLADRRAHRGAPGAVRTAYRAASAILLGLAVVYGLSCLPLLLGVDRTADYGHDVAIAIASVSFAELTAAVVGLVSSRRRRDLLMELNMLCNVSAGLVLLVLTQTALLSMSGDGDHRTYNGLCGTIMVVIIAGIGTVMLLRTHEGPGSS